MALSRRLSAALASGSPSLAELGALVWRQVVAMATVELQLRIGAAVAASAEPLERLHQWQTATEERPAHKPLIKATTTQGYPWSCHSRMRCWAAVLVPAVGTAIQGVCYPWSPAGGALMVSGHASSAAATPRHTPGRTGRRDSGASAQRVSVPPARTAWRLTRRAPALSPKQLSEQLNTWSPRSRRGVCARAIKAQSFCGCHNAATALTGKQFCPRGKF